MIKTRDLVEERTPSEQRDKKVWWCPKCKKWYPEEDTTNLKFYYRRIDKLGHTVGRNS